MMLLLLLQRSRWHRHTMQTLYHLVRVLSTGESCRSHRRRHAVRRRLWQHPRRESRRGSGRQRHGRRSTSSGCAGSREEAAVASLRPRGRHGVARGPGRGRGRGGGGRCRGTAALGPHSVPHVRTRAHHRQSCNRTASRRKRRLRGCRCRGCGLADGQSGRGGASAEKPGRRSSPTCAHHRCSCHHTAATTSGRRLGEESGAMADWRRQLHGSPCNLVGTPAARGPGAHSATRMPPSVARVMPHGRACCP